MTDLLKDTFTTQAAGSEPPPLDLDALIATGSRRIRRRRVGAVLGTAFAVAAVVATSLVVVRSTVNEPPVAGLPFSEARPTYAVNGVIHFGDAKIDTGAKQLDRLVRTNLGFLYTEAGSNTLHLADGRTTRTVATIEPGSKFYAAGDYAAWVTSGVKGTIPVLTNLRTDKAEYDTEPPPKDSKRFEWSQVVGSGLIGVDDRAAYIGRASEVFGFALPAKPSTSVVELPKGAVSTVAAGAGRYVFLAPGPENTGRYVYLRTDTTPPAPQALEAFNGSPEQLSASISPKGSYVSLTADGASPHLYDVTGHRIQIGQEFRMFGQWLSDDTFVAVAGNDLSTCFLDGTYTTCTVIARDIAPHGERLTLSAN
ncbi:hypothetical protein ACFVWG_17845 [Kribbella sp. NPDC058245]|uniref:hypothetical protein n=1 Tax=Kribbella sp. NPDC058245 TaxID=3346399 RepID=UPI0036EDE923